MTWITTCTAPDLSKLFTPVISNYLLNVTFVGRGGSDSPVVRAYVHLFIVCTDKALRAYNAGRELLLEYSVSSNRTAVLFHGIAEFETCISTVKRCLSRGSRGRLARGAGAPARTNDPRWLALRPKARKKPFWAFGILSGRFPFLGRRHIHRFQRRASCESRKRLDQRLGGRSTAPSLNRLPPAAGITARCPRFPASAGSCGGHAPSEMRTSARAARDDPATRP
jgi:hypothetical protein